jgi:N-glycosidase YbiA
MDRTIEHKKKYGIYELNASLDGKKLFDETNSYNKALSICEERHNDFVCGLDGTNDSIGYICVIDRDGNIIGNKKVRKIIRNFYPKTDYHFLSNFFECDFKFMGVTYKTCEHYFQAAKATNEKNAQKIIDAKTPADAKSLGRKIVIRKDWEDIKIDVMRFALRLKFQDKVLKELLLETGDAELEEGNHWQDLYWGVNESRYGENWLGKLLMELRENIKDWE